MWRKRVVDRPSTLVFVSLSGNTVQGRFTLTGAGLDPDLVCRRRCASPLMSLLAIFHAGNSFGDEPRPYSRELVSLGEWQRKQPPFLRVGFT